MFVDFAKRTPTLDSIWLNFLPGWTRDVARYWDPSEQNSEPLAGHIIRSKTLAICGYMPLGFTWGIPRMFDLSMITNLILNDFNLWVLVDTLAPADALCNLVRFGCTTLDALSPEWAAILQSFLERNLHLEHVRLSLCALTHYGTHPPESMTIEDYVDPASFLWPLRNSLQSLAWHDPQRTISDDGDSRVCLGYVCPSSLESLCCNFPCLQQLGLKAPDQPINVNTRHTGWQYHLLAYLVSISSIRLSFSTSHG